jgi:hypothetical protein
VLAAAVVSIGLIVIVALIKLGIGEDRHRPTTGHALNVVDTAGSRNARYQSALQRRGTYSATGTATASPTGAGVAGGNADSTVRTIW